MLTHPGEVWAPELKRHGDEHSCEQVPRARHLLTSVLLAMAPKVWMHKPDIPGLLVVRIVEKHSLSTGQAGPGQKKIPLKQSGHGWHHHTPLTPSKTLVPRKVIIVKVSCFNIKLLGASTFISASDAPPLVSWLLQTLTILSSSP